MIVPNAKTFRVPELNKMSSIIDVQRYLSKDFRKSIYDLYENLFIHNNLILILFIKDQLLWIKIEISNIIF